MLSCGYHYQHALNSMVRLEGNVRKCTGHGSITAWDRCSESCCGTSFCGLITVVCVTSISDHQLQHGHHYRFFRSWAIYKLLMLSSKN